MARGRDSKDLEASGFKDAAAQEQVKARPASRRAAGNSAAIKHLESQIKYKFKSRPLLQRALTHASKRTEKKNIHDNERLEFLGDRVLALAIAELLTELDPQANEGELARRFNRLVRKETCARVARSIGLGPALMVSASEAESGGRDKDTILGDACEALLGAIFLEAGFPAARDVVRSLWVPLVDSLPKVSTDAKSALQEWAQGQGLALPEYVEVARQGPDHAPRFISEVRIADRKPARGEGATKRAAEQAAAMELLAREGVWKSGSHA
ncbi:MAG: ribonuclease III [Bacteroidota bacterium]|jgi:ribonuclease-3